MATTRSLRKNKPPPAFYEPPGQHTSAKIIAEARKSVRSLPTDRPFTPADSSRILFGSAASQSRPPSVYSIGARHFSDERLSRPPTGHAAKLEPIEKSVVLTEHIKKAAAKRAKPTPPTPVQSLQDLTATFETQRSDEEDKVPRPHSRTAVASHTVLMVGSLESASGSSVSSAELEPKPSQLSPPISKRTLSAGKRVLSGGGSGRSGKESGRVRSAESKGGDVMRRSSPPTTAERKNDLIVTSSARRSSQPPPTTVEHRNDVIMTSSQQSTKKSEVKSVETRTAQSDSKHRAKSDTPPSLPVWDAEIIPLLCELESSSYSDVAHLCQLSDALLSTLETNALLGRGGGAGGSKKRARILRSVFKLLDHKDPKLLLKVAKIILAMKVTGKNMTNVCKLLFSLSKNEQNDAIFAQEEIAKPVLELLSSADPASDSEALVYGLGTVKLLASNAELREQLASCDVMALVNATLHGCTEKSSIDKSHVANILIQLTGALRNLSDAASLRSVFLSSPLFPRLASVLSDHMTSTDIVFNISRLLSKLSQQSDFQLALSQCSSFLPLFLQALTTHSDHPDIVVRVCFILGNLTSTSAETREELFFRHSALPVLNELFDKFFAIEEKQLRLPKHGSSSDVGSESPKKQLNKAEDVLIKLVRLVANLSVHPEVGPAIATDENCLKGLLKILAAMAVVEYEELVLNTLATLNNLSYYASDGSCFVRRHREIAELLVEVVLVDNNNGLLECTRVYGNLSRFPDVRQVLTDKKIGELMVTVLDSGHRELVYCACGVLLNLMGDHDHRDALAALGAIKKLVEVLEDFGHADWQLASLVCKTLWNYSENLTSNGSLFGEDESKLLVNLLQTYIAEPTGQTGHDLTRILWKTEFLPVAKDLLSRLQSPHSNLIPLLSSEDAA